MCGRKRTNGGRWPGKRRPKGCIAEVEYTRRVCRGRRTREEEKLYGRVGFVFPLVPSWTRPRLLHVGTRQRRCNRRERVLLALHRTQRHGCPRRPARVRLVHLADTVTSRHPRAKGMDQPGWVSLRFRRVHEHDGYRIVLDFRRRWYVVRLRSSVFGLRSSGRSRNRERSNASSRGRRSIAESGPIRWLSMFPAAYARAAPPSVAPAFIYSSDQSPSRPCIARSERLRTRTRFRKVVISRRRYLSLFSHAARSSALSRHILDIYTRYVSNWAVAGDLRDI